MSGILEITDNLKKNTVSPNEHQAKPNSSQSINADHAAKISPPDERLCAQCWGMGYVLPPWQNGRPSNAITCPNNCNSSENRLKLRSVSQIEGDKQRWFLRGGRFPKQITRQVSNLVKLLYSQDPSGFWYFHGPNGCGKTYIITAAINEAIRQQRSGMYTNALELLNHLRQQIRSDDAMAESRYIKLVKNTTVLSIDEYGRHRDTPYSTEVLFDILDARYQRANLYTNAAHDKKLTLLASNLPVEELEPWLQSRLRDRNSVIVDMSNLPDRRDN